MNMEARNAGMQADRQQQETKKIKYAQSKEQQVTRKLFDEAKRADRQKKAHQDLYRKALEDLRAERRKEAVKGVYNEALDDIEVKARKGQELDEQEYRALKNDLGSKAVDANMVEGLKKTIESPAFDGAKREKKSIEGSELIESQLVEVDEEFSDRVTRDIARAEKSQGRDLTQVEVAAIKESQAKVALKTLDVIDRNILKELKKFDHLEETTDEERKLEELAGELFDIRSEYEKIVEGEALTADDIVEEPRIEPKMPPEFLEEDPAILAAQEKEQKLRDITPEIPPAFLEEDPEIQRRLEQAEELAVQLEESEVEVIDEPVDYERQTVEMAGLSDELFQETIRRPGFEASQLPQETIQQYGFSWMFENPDVKPSPEKRALNLEDETSNENKARIADLRRQLRDMFGAEQGQALWIKNKEGKVEVPKEFSGLAHAELLGERVQSTEAIMIRAVDEAKRLIEFKKEYTASGLLYPPELQKELDVAIELAFQKRLDHYKWTAEFNQTVGALMYSKDKRKGAEFLYGSMKDNLKSALSVRNKAESIRERLRPMYEAGRVNGSEKFVEHARRQFTYAEKRIEDLLEIQKNNPFAENSVEYSHLNQMLAEVSSMKSELAYFELDQSVYAMNSEHGVDEIGKLSLGEYVDSDSAEIIAGAVTREAGERYAAISSLAELGSERQNLAESYRNAMKEVADLRVASKKVERALGQLGYDRGTSEGDWLNRNVFSWVNRWNLRKTVNTGQAGEAEIAVFKSLNEVADGLVSEDAIAQLESGNITSAGMNELLAVRSNIENAINQREDVARELISQGFAVGERIEQIQTATQAQA